MAHDATDRDPGAAGRQESGGGPSKGTKRDQTFGAGMTSPDSTEAVLDASTGEPDPRAAGPRPDRGPSTAAQDQDLEQDV